MSNYFINSYRVERVVCCDLKHTYKPCLQQRSGKYINEQKNSYVKSHNIFSSLIIHGIIGVIILKLLLRCRVKR